MQLYNRQKLVSDDKKLDQWLTRLEMRELTAKGTKELLRGSSNILYLVWADSYAVSQFILTIHFKCLRFTAYKSYQ